MVSTRDIFWTESISGDILKKPVIEIDIQKNKISEFKDILYYKFSPEYSKFYECNKDEVSVWRGEHDRVLKRVEDKRNPSAGDNPFISHSDIDVR